MVELKEGDKVPDFKGLDQNENPISMAQYKGKKLILFFYPKDNTPGCTAQACNLRDNMALLQQHGFELLGVSADGVKSHQKFIEKYELPFPLVADTEKQMNEQFGVWVEKSMYGRKYMGTARTTFVIDEKGVIVKVIKKVDTKNHAAQILKELGL